MGSVAQEILDKSLSHKLGLAAWENGLIIEAIRLLNAGDADLMEQIALAVERNRSKESIQRLKNIRKELRQVNKDAYFGALSNLVRKSIGDAAVRVSALQATTVELAVPFALSFSRPSAQLLRSIITSKPFEGALLRGHLERLAGNRLAAMVREIEIGLLEQESISQLQRRVRGTSPRFADGVLAKVGRAQAEKILRTAAQHVTETARDMTLQENADVLRGVMWVSTLDDRTCKICQPRDGLVWTAKHHRPVGHSAPWGGGPGRIHFLCRCTSIAVLKSLGALNRAGFSVDQMKPAERAAMEGPVPITVSYPEWLRAQSKATQVRVLGKARAEEFRAGLSLEASWAKKFNARVFPAQSLDRALPLEPVLSGAT